MADPTHPRAAAPGPGRTRTADPDPIPADRPTATSPPSADTGLADAVGDHFLRLAEPADAGTRGDDSGPTAPAGYELLGEVGRGGMGVVYRARDTAFGRDVAVKLLRDRAAPDSPAARRFLDEARITGQLQHPGIPAAHQVGALSDGRPFLVMKLIKGRTLDDLLDERPDPAADRGVFLAVFEQVCQAVGYAHAHRVVHRDLKPANVMVGAFGEVQVMDWGLAKVLTGPGGHAAGADPDATLGTEIRSARDADSETQAGSVLGTPAFMPPEQAIGAVDQIDQRSDVFGLGGVLCAVLTGKPPYVSGTAESTRQLAARAKLDDALARLGACGADPELVALCRRCLSPEKGDRPADAGEVARAVTGLRTAAEERARRAELDRVRAEAEAREQRRRRRAQLGLAASVGLLLAGGGAVGWWQDRQAADRRAQRARNADALAELVARCEQALREDDADRAAAALAEVDRRLAEGGGEVMQDRADRCRADLAILRELNTIDNFRWTLVGGKLPDPGAVAALLRMAFDVYEVAPGMTPSEELIARLGGSLVRDRLLAALDLWLVISPHSGLQDVLRMADPDPHRTTVRGAITAGDVARVSELVNESEALVQPPGFAAALGQYKAVPVERRRAMLGAVLRSRPGDITALMELGNSFANNRLEDTAEQLRWYQAAVAAHPRNVAARSDLGFILLMRGDMDGAIAHFREVVRLDPKNAGAHNNLGAAMLAKNDLDAAVASFREAIRLDPNFAGAHDNLGVAMLAKRDMVAAVASFREVIRLDSKNAGAHYNLGFALADTGDVDGSIAYYRETVRLDPSHFDAHANLGTVLCDVKQDYIGAIACFREALRLDSKSARAHYNMGNALLANGNSDEAISSYREAIRLDPEYARPHYSLGNALSEKGDRDGAVAAYREAVRLDPKDARAHYNLGVTLLVKGDIDGAIAASREAVRLDTKDASAHYNLGIALLSKGDLDVSIGSLWEAVRQDSEHTGAHDVLAQLLAVGPDGVRDGRRAVEHATRACELTGWKNAGFIDTLAAAYAEVGDFVKATEYQTKALSDPAYERQHGAEGRQRLALYARKMPYRDPTLARREVIPPPRPAM